MQWENLVNQQPLQIDSNDIEKFYGVSYLIFEKQS